MFARGVGRMLRWIINKLVGKALGEEAANREAKHFLPTFLYVIGVVGLFGWALIILTARKSEALKEVPIGYLLGYAIVSVMSIFAAARVIELLQAINANLSDRLHHQIKTQNENLELLSSAVNKLVEIEKLKLQRAGQKPTE